MNPIVINLGSLFHIQERFGRRKGRNFYSPELAAEKLNIAYGQLQSLMAFQKVRPSFIRIELPFLTDEDIDQLRSLLVGHENVEAEESHDL